MGFINDMAETVLQRALLGEDILRQRSCKLRLQTSCLHAWRPPSWLQLSRLPYDQGRVTSPSQIVVPRNSAQRSIVAFRPKAVT